MTEETTPVPVPASPYAWVTQMQEGSADRTLKTLKLIGVVLVLMLVTAVVSALWAFNKGKQSQAVKVEYLERTVIQQQDPIIKKVYEDRIVYKDRIETIEVPKIVEKKVYQNVCFDDEGVDAFNKLMKP